MENATKALIIAGSVIISIMLISVGIFIYQAAIAPAQNIDMSDQEKQVFNQQFTPYEGPKVTGSKVKQLCEAARSNNAKYSDETTKQVHVTLESDNVTLQPDDLIQDIDDQDKTTEPSTVKAKIKDGYTYRVQLSKDSKSDIVTHIHISRVTK